MPDSLSIEATAAQLAWLQNREALRRYVVMLSPLKLSTGAVVDFYFTDSVWSDDEAFNYRPLLKGDITIRQSLNSDLVGGSSRSGSSLVIDNTSGEFDGWLDNFSWGGRSIKIYGSDPEDLSWTEIDDYAVLFEGFIETISFDSGANITVKYNPESGSSNVDIYGSPDAVDENQRWPLLFGHVYNSTALPFSGDNLFDRNGDPFSGTITDAQKIFKFNRLGIDEVLHVYVSAVEQDDSGPIVLSIQEVIDEQALLTAGETCSSIVEGILGVHGTAAGTVTVECVGWKASQFDGLAAGYLVKAIRSAGTAVNSKFEGWVNRAGLINQFYLDAPQESGIAFRGTLNMFDAVSEVITGVGAVFWWNNRNEMCLKVVSEPDASESQGDILESVDIIGEVSARRWQAPTHRVTLRYNKNYTVQEGDGLPATVDVARSFLAREWREASAQDSTVSDAHKDSQELFRDTAMQKASDAYAEASRLLALLGVPRKVYKVRSWNRVGGYALMDTWHLTHSRLAPGGKYVRVISVNDNVTKGYTDLELWG